VQGVRVKGVDERKQLLDCISFSCHCLDEWGGALLLGIVEGGECKLLLVLEMAVNPALLQTGAIHHVTDRRSAIAALVEECRGLLNDILARLLALSHDPPLEKKPIGLFGVYTTLNDHASGK
jgi:hypothetical protein